MMMKRTIVGLCFALLSSTLFSPLAWALPTVQQVEAEVNKGNYTQAETMMGEVVAAKPGSARAHYFYAEILAHNANFTRATEEATKARQLDPQLSFTDPEKFRSFEQLLQRQQNPPARPRAAPTTQGYSAPASVPAMTNAARPSGGIPGWVWLVGLVVLAVVVWKMFARRPAAAAGGNFAAAGMPSGNFPGGGAVGGGLMGGGPMGGGMQYGNNGVAPGGAGSGLLKTGLAVGAGVAGGMLIDEMMHRRSDGSASSAGFGNLGGVDPGSYDPAADSAARELESRPIDFGQGGNDWDSGGGSADSGSDGGSSWD